VEGARLRKVAKAEVCGLSSFYQSAVHYPGKLGKKSGLQNHRITEW